MANILNEKEQLIIGINWGGIKSKGWFGSVEYAMADLDLNVLILEKESKNIKEIVNKMNVARSTIKNGVKIEEDDNYGDLNGNDGKDNEWAIINLENIPSENILIPFIYNYSNINWENLSHLEFRIYSGEPNNDSKIINFQNLLDKEFENEKILIPGNLFKESNNWYFDTFDQNEKINLLKTKEILNQLKTPF